MNCEKAKELIDLRVHELTSGATDAARVGAPPPFARGDKGGLTSPNPLLGKEGDWSELDAHLDACPHCRAEFEELRRVRQLLATAANERPNDVETQNMWMGIQSALAVPVKPMSTNAGQWWIKNRSLVVAMTGIAAVLVAAFLLGDLRYGGFSLSRAREMSKALVGADGIGAAARRTGRDQFSNVDQSLPTGSPASGDLSTAPSAGRRAAQQKAMASLGYSAGGAQPIPALPALPPPSIQVASPPNDEQHLRFRRDPQTATASGGGFTSAWVSGDPAFAGGNWLIGGNLEGYAAKSAESHESISYGYEVPFGPKDTERDARANEFVQEDTAGNVLIGGNLEGFRDKSDHQPAGEPKPGASRPSEAQTRTPPIPQNLKIIKTGTLTIQVPVYAESIARVEQIVRENNGFVADGTTREEAGGALVGRLVIRVSPERFEETFAALKSVGRVESENVKAADVTAEYVDTEARIQSLRITEERLRDLIANKSFVDKIASLLEVEKELNRVRTEIEQMQGQLRVMADRVALSTIIVTVREPGRTVPSASLSVEVPTLAEAAKKLGDMLASAGGRLVSGKTSKRSDGTLMGEFQLETTLARFAEVVTAIESMGRVEERQVKDQQFSEANEPWAKHVTCSIALVLFERSRQLPSANVRVEVDKLDAAVKRLGEILQTNDAAIASNQASRQSDGSNSAEIRVRVPAGKFAGLFDSLASLGRVISKNVAGEAGSIVGGAAAVPCDVALTLAEKPREVPKGSMTVEVAAFESARQSLSRAIAERQVQVLSSSSNQRDDGTWQGSFRLGVPAKEMEAFVGKLESLGRVAARQITGLGLGDLSRIDPDSLGVIDLTMAEKSSITPAPDQASNSIRARIRDALGGFYTSIGLIAYGLVVLLPWLLLAVLLGWLLSRIRRALRNRRALQNPPA